MTRISLTKNVECGDQLTKDDYQVKLNQFIEKNRNKDVHHSWGVSHDVPGFKEKIAVTTRDDGGAPSWMSSGIFCCFSCFGMTWPYRFVMELGILLCILVLARPAQAIIQMLATSSQIITIILKSLGLY